MSRTFKVIEDNARHNHEMYLKWRHLAKEHMDRLQSKYGISSRDLHVLKDAIVYAEQHRMLHSSGLKELREVGKQKKLWDLLTRR